MRNIIAGQHALTDDEFAELALGIDTELFAGPAGGESDLARAVRLAAAHDILADLRREDPELADYAERLLNAAHADRLTADACPRLALLLGGRPRSGKSAYIAVLEQVAA